ncbi:Uncharacterised protein [Bordetella pertussis]|nr:Uncharacterised protein [Bordetella pertussis]
MCWGSWCRPRQLLFLVVVHETEQRARLRVVVLVDPMVPAVGGLSVQRQRRFGCVLGFAPFAETVGFVVQRGAAIAVDPAHPVAMEAVERAARRIDGNLMVVDAQAVAMGVAVREQATLQHLVGRKADARHHIGRRERGLFDFGEIVLGVLVQFQHAHFDQGVVGMRPHLGQVERVDVIGGGLGFGHYLHLERPARELALLDVLEQVALRAFAIAADQLGGFAVRITGDALLRLEVELDVETLAGVVDEAVGMRAEAVLLAIVLRQSAIAHQDGDLVQRFRVERPEVPGGGGVAQVGLGVALLGMDEVGELERIANEEHGRVVADQVPVAFVGIELDGEATHVTFGVGRAALAGHGRKAQEQRRLLADFGEDPGARVAGNVMRDREGAIGARAFGVHHALGNAFTVEVGQFLQEPDVLQQGGAARPRRHGVVVVGNRRTGGGSEGLVGHCVHPSRGTAR